MAYCLRNKKTRKLAKGVNNSKMTWETKKSAKRFIGMGNVVADSFSIVRCKK